MTSLALRGRCSIAQTGQATPELVGNCLLDLGGGSMLNIMSNSLMFQKRRIFNVNPIYIIRYDTKKIEGIKKFFKFFHFSTLNIGPFVSEILVLSINKNAV